MNIFCHILHLTIDDTYTVILSSTTMICLDLRERRPAITPLAQTTIIHFQALERMFDDLLLKNDRIPYTGKLS